MKRFVSLLLGAALIFSLSIPAFAASEDIKVTVDGKEVVFTDAKPFRDENNRTLLPVRFVSEAMDAEVTWNNDTRVATIVKNGTQVDITIGSQTLKVMKSGKTSTGIQFNETAYVTMDTVAVIRDNRTYLPIRFVVEALDGYVDWVSIYNTVEIISGGGNVSAAEIKRLRSYSPIQHYSEKVYVHGVAMQVSDELKAIYDTKFDQTYWFANAHHYLMNCCPESKLDVTDDFNSTVLKKGADERAYIAAAIKYIETAASTKIEDPNRTKVALPFSSSNGLYQLKFRTCDALAYHELSGTMEAINIRGVLEVTVNNNQHAKENLATFTEDFGIQNPEVGKTYSVDAEFVIGLDAWGSFIPKGKYTLDSNGNHILWS